MLFSNVILLILLSCLRLVIVRLVSLDVRMCGLRLLVMVSWIIGKLFRLKVMICGVILFGSEFEMWLRVNCIFCLEVVMFVL